MKKKQSASASADTTEIIQKKPGGGTAIGGGVNFQAVVTTIVGVHIMRGVALDWLEGVRGDIPTAVWAESEGPGDDLRIEFGTSAAIEVQVKKGLQRSESLWTALMSLANAIHAGQLSQGVLVVGVDSSASIREELSVDVERLGEGRCDQLSSIGTEWLNRLNQANISVTEICRNMRIKVIHGRSEDGTTIVATKNLLRSVCALETDVDAAWNYLYRQAVRSMEKRGRWVLQDLVRHFRSAGIAIREGDFPSSNFDRYSKWIINNNEFFYLTGIRSRIPLTQLLPMHLERMNKTSTIAKDAASALEHYHKSPLSVRFSDEFDAEWTGRFKRMAVIVAGPGLGKSTMLKQLAYQYSADGYWVFSVSLKRIAAATKNGSAFLAAFWQHALDSSPLALRHIDSLSGQRWVLLLDGLDECGKEQNFIAAQIRSFVSGHPGVRVVVTTRPIGYETTEFAEGWTHYRLLPPRKEDGASNLNKLMRSIQDAEGLIDGQATASSEPFMQSRPSEAIAISPHLLGLAASLIHHRRTLPSTRIELYKQLLLQFDRHPANDANENADTYATVLNIVGWTLLKNPLIFFDGLVESVACMLAPMLQVPVLPAKLVVRNAVSLWEKVGLVEQVHFDGQAMLTFVHKTFCEFTAARFLVQQPQFLVEAVDQSESQEVLDFAAGQGFADHMIQFYLRKYADGNVGQLQSAIGLLGKTDVGVSVKWSTELVATAFRAIENGSSEKFSIGVALTEVATRAQEFVALTAKENLGSKNQDVKFVAWAIAVCCSENRHSAVTLSSVLSELRGIVAPTEFTLSLMKHDRGDRQLFEIIALAALRAQPDDCIREFAEQELMEKGHTWIFSLKVDHILKERGIEQMHANLDKAEKSRMAVTVTPIGPTGSELSQKAYRAVAKAFAKYEPPLIGATLKQAPPLVHFSGFIRAAGLMNVPISDFYKWWEEYDEIASQETLRAVALLTSVDLHMLAEDANELLRQLEVGIEDYVLATLPAVDIDSPDWDKAKSTSINSGEVMRGLVHPSSWINYMALQICEHYDFALTDLSELLKEAKGYSIRCVFHLLTKFGVDEAFSILLTRLYADSSGDVSTIFDLVLKAKVMPDEQLMATTLACLHSTHEGTAKAAAECLSCWVDAEVTVAREKIASAFEHWNGDGSMNSFVVTPAFVLNEVIQKLNSTDGT